MQALWFSELRQTPAKLAAYETGKKLDVLVSEPFP
jgi:hypothetical protein